MTDERDDGSGSTVGRPEEFQGERLPKWPGPGAGGLPGSTGDTAQYQMELVEVTGYLVVTLRRRRVVTGTLEQLSAAYEETERHNSRARWISSQWAFLRVSRASSANAGAWQDVCDQAGSEQFLRGSGPR